MNVTANHQDGEDVGDIGWDGEDREFQFRKILFVVSVGHPNGNSQKEKIYKYIILSWIYKLGVQKRGQIGEGNIDDI